MAAFVQRFEFLKQYKIHIASVCFAVLVWFLVISDSTFDYIVTIPIRVPANPAHLILAQPIPTSASVRVRGQGSALLAFLIFREAQLEPKVEWKLGTQTVHFSKEDIVLNGNAKTISVTQLIDPLEQTIVIEKLDKKNIPIKSRAKVKPLSGHTVVGDMVFDPNRIEIEGPASTLQNIDTAYSVDLLLEKIKRPVHGQIALSPFLQSGVSVSHSQVSFFLDVQKLMEKRISKIPVRVINSPADVTAFAIPASLSLVAEGGVQVVANLTEKQINAYIDYQRIPDNGGSDYSAYVDPLPGIRYRAIEPKRFKVILERNK